MPYSQRSFTCPDCGTPVLRRRAKGSVVRCPPCAIEYSAESARQLHAHSGPLYDKWLLGNLIGAGRSRDFSDQRLLARGL